MSISYAVFCLKKKNEKTSGIEIAIRKLGWLFMISGAVFGMLVLLKIGGLSIVTRLAYTGFDLSLLLMALTSVVSLLSKMTLIKGEKE